MSPKRWGNPTWIFLHTLAHKVPERNFGVLRRHLFSMLARICHNLPCPECADHASRFVGSIDVDKVSRKSDFVNLLFVFHNIVNRRKGHRQFKYEDLNVYASVGIIPAFNAFVRNFNTDGNMALLNEAFRRQLMMKSLRGWFLKNMQLFELGTQPVSPPLLPLLPPPP